MISTPTTWTTKNIKERFGSCVKRTNVCSTSIPPSLCVPVDLLDEMFGIHIRRLSNQTSSLCFDTSKQSGQQLQILITCHDINCFFFNLPTNMKHSKQRQSINTFFTRWKKIKMNFKFGIYTTLYSTVMLANFQLQPDLSSALLRDIFVVNGVSSNYFDHLSVNLQHSISFPKYWPVAVQCASRCWVRFKYWVHTVRSFQSQELKNPSIYPTHVSFACFFLAVFSRSIFYFIAHK